MSASDTGDAVGSVAAAFKGAPASCITLVANIRHQLSLAELELHVSTNRRQLQTLDAALAAVPDEQKPKVPAWERIILRLRVQHDLLAKPEVQKMLADLEDRRGGILPMLRFIISANTPAGLTRAVRPAALFSAVTPQPDETVAAYTRRLEETLTATTGSAYNEYMPATDAVRPSADADTGEAVLQRHLASLHNTVAADAPTNDAHTRLRAAVSDLRARKTAERAALVELDGLPRRDESRAAKETARQALTTAIAQLTYDIATIRRDHPAVVALEREHIMQAARAALHGTTTAFEATTGDDREPVLNAHVTHLAKCTAMLEVFCFNHLYVTLEADAVGAQVIAAYNAAQATASPPVYTYTAFVRFCRSQAHADRRLNSTHKRARSPQQDLPRTRATAPPTPPSPAQRAATADMNEAERSCAQAFINHRPLAERQRFKAEHRCLLCERTNHTWTTCRSWRQVITPQRVTEHEQQRARRAAERAALRRAPSSPDAAAAADGWQHVPPSLSAQPPPSN